VDVVVEAHVRRLAADHVDLCEAGQLVLAHGVLDQLVARVRVRVVLFLRHGERTELALHAADVRLVEVQVLDEEDSLVAAALTARQVGELAEPEQVIGLHQRDAVVEVQPLAGLDLPSDRRQRVCPLEQRHQCSLFTTAYVKASSSSRCTSPFRHARALRAYASATSRLSSSAPVEATRRSAPSSCAPPARAARTASSRWAARRSGRVGVPSRRSVPAILPVSIVTPEQSRMSSVIWNATPSASPNDPEPPARRHAASKSFPVFSVQRSRYASIVVSGSNRCERCIASPRARHSVAFARTASASALLVAASSANARAKR